MILVLVLPVVVEVSNIEVVIIHPRLTEDQPVKGLMSKNVILKPALFLHLIQSTVVGAILVPVQSAVVEEFKLEIVIIQNLMMVVNGVLASIFKAVILNPVPLNQVVILAMLMVDGLTGLIVVLVVVKDGNVEPVIILLLRVADKCVVPIPVIASPKILEVVISKTVMIKKDQMPNTTTAT